MSLVDNLAFLAACGTGCVFAGLATLPRPGSRRTLSAGARLTGAALLLMVSVWCMFRLALRAEFLHVDPDLPWSTMLRASAIAVCGILASLGIATFGPRSVRNVALAGSLLSAGSSCMMFACMSDLTAPSVLAYDLVRLLAAMVASSALFGCGLWLLWRPAGHTGRIIPGALIAASLLGLAVISLSSILPFAEWNMASEEPGAMAFRPMTVVFLSELAVTLALTLAGVGFDRRAAALIGRENDRLRQLSDCTFEGLLIHRNGVVLDANTAFCTMTGRSLDTVAGKPVTEFLCDAAPTTTPSSSPSGKPVAVEIEITGEDGRALPVEMLSRQIAYTGGMATITALRDIRERRESEARIRFLAQHDPLTSLPNRVQFRDTLIRELAIAAREGRSVALLGIDLDRFKMVNDTLGHQMGDLLLQQVAERMVSSIRAGDMVSRVGGDEFLLLQTGVQEPSAAARLAGKLIECLSLPFDLDGQQACIGASIGIALAPQDSTQVDELINRADIALYRVKTSGRGQYCFYKAGMDELLRERREMERDIGAAIASGGFELAYQPMFDGGADSEVLGCEALLRWTHPTHGPIAPDRFIPIAEETGLILPLGAWVLETACREAMAWPASLRVAVNVSPRQISNPGFVELVAQVLNRTGLPGARLELEITETILIRDAEAAMEVLVRLKALGVQIVLDDFGTGYSSLSYLQRFPFDKVKIDKYFVQSLQESDNARAIVGAILAMCHQLNLHVTAEGVEEHEQLRELITQHCDEVQGFLLSRPLAAGAIRPFLDWSRQDRGPDGATRVAPARGTVSAIPL
jgi:diguanylate cyclase